MIQEGAQSDSIKGYKLPVCNTNTEKRNFPGMKKQTLYSLQDLIKAGEGVESTETNKGGTGKN
jgi:hypothetical protein